MLVAVLGGGAAGCCTMVDSPIVLCSWWWTSGRTGHTRTIHCSVIIGRILYGLWENPL